MNGNLLWNDIFLITQKLIGVKNHEHKQKTHFSFDIQYTNK